MDTMFREIGCESQAKVAAPSDASFDDNTSRSEELSGIRHAAVRRADWTEGKYTTDCHHIHN